MKHTWLVAVAVLLSVSAATAQEIPQAPQTQTQQPVMGRGRGGAPFAWNDQNRDGVCDLTGRAVGQRPIGYGRGRGWRAMSDQPAAQAAGPGQGQAQGRGGAGWGRGGGRGARWR
jgi:hypothetical protein